MNSAKSRRALLEKRADRLARLLRRVRLREGVDSRIDGGSKVGVPPADDQLLLQTDGRWTAGDHPLDQVDGHALELTGGDDAVHEPPSERGLRGDGIAGKQQLRGAAGPDEPR